MFSLSFKHGISKHQGWCRSATKTGKRTLLRHLWASTNVELKVTDDIFCPADALEYSL